MRFPKCHCLKVGSRKGLKPSFNFAPKKGAVGVKNAEERIGLGFDFGFDLLYWADVRHVEEGNLGRRTAPGLRGRGSGGTG